MVRRLFSAVVLAAALASACARPAPELGPAPDFTLRDLAGGQLQLASLKGKVLVLDFWATWCGPCIKEMPDYADFWRKNKARGVEVIGVVFDSGEPQEIDDFVRHYRIPYRQLVGDNEVLAAYDATTGFPTTFVIDKQGMIKSKILGATADKFKRLQDEVDAALAAAESAS